MHFSIFPGFFIKNFIIIIIILAFCIQIIIIIIFHYSCSLLFCFQHILLPIWDKTCATADWLQRDKCQSVTVSFLREKQKHMRQQPHFVNK
jgi:hypothetical protein